ncbi:MAG TPA: adenylate/guanylate cyclase domain-containing protein, partial [Gaiellaceae bacterium]|nr:adenylate/guanylate cyclase domain-containing protein [Gaiellaceae bacterium]
FERALAVARRDGARALELRAALALARSAAPGDRAAATALERAVGWFREGVDTPDLAAARRYLVEHGGGGVAAARPHGGGVRYARSGDLSIAFEVTGLDGPDLVLVPGFVSHLQKDWQEPRHARFLDRLGSFSRLIRFDKRGTGLSDRPGGTPDLEARMDDVRAVMDAAGSERAVVLGYSEGGPMAILFAATYPERVESLVLYGAYATRVRRDDYPWAATAEERRSYADRIEREWGWEADLQRMCPTADVELARWWGERARAAASPGAARALVEMNSQIDVRELLPALRVPTLVIHRTGDVDVAVEEARYLAARIPSAQLVELPGVDHFVAVDPDAILDVVEPFVRGRPQVPSAPTADDGPGQRVLATILVTDLPHAAREIERLGDRGWAELRRRHDEAVRDELRRHSGEDVDNAGEGFVATFDGPGRAIRCAVNVRERLAELGLVVRIGLHTGEIVRCPQDVRGIAVHTAARVAAQAEPGEVLVTATTRDLVAGSGLAFDDRGERSLKGLDGARRLFAVAA